MKTYTKPTQFLAVTIRLHGPDAEWVNYAAAMAGKSPDQFLTDLVIWTSRMDGKGPA